MTPEYRHTGDDLLEACLPEGVSAWVAAEKMRRHAEIEEAVSAIRSVTVQFNPLMTSVEQVCDWMAEAIGHAAETAQQSERLVIPVRYGGEDGPDLDMVAQSAGLSADELISLHTHKDYPVEMIGFTPGFGYLGGLDPVINVGRLDQPRERVLAGSVGIIRGYSCIYPLPGPGGWPLIGRTGHLLFDAQAENPFRLAPGMTVRFEAV